MNIHSVINGIRRFLWVKTLRAANLLYVPLPPKGEDITTTLTRRVHDAEVEAQREKMKLLGATSAWEEEQLSDDELYR